MSTITTMTPETRRRLLNCLDLSEQERVELIAQANAEGSTFEEIARVLAVAAALS